ncbi:DUF58 domain-containing protein [Frankia sp. CcWB3]
MRNLRVRDFVAALRGLTIRGRSFVAAGIACAASAAVLGEQDLLRIGLLLILLPVLAAAFVCRTRYRLACTRRLEPSRVTAGDRVSVRIRLENVSRSPSSVLLVEDAAADGLGGGVRFVLGRIEPGGSRDLSYVLHAGMRGRYQIGPMAIRLGDPFGLCELSRSFRSLDELVVAPPIERLPSARPTGAARVSTQLRRPTGLAGENETTTRPYRSGDDLRKVHWKTTARRGELMVRREEHPQTGGATILIDTRARAWPDRGPSASFEWAVSAVGAIGVHLVRGGYRVRLLADQGLAAIAAGGTVGGLLDELSTLTPAPTESLHPSLAAGRRQADHGGMFVAVLGHTDAPTAAALAGLRPRSAPAIAVLVDVASWSTAAAAPKIAADLGTTHAVLTRAGWAVLVAAAGTSLAAMWPRVAARARGTGGVGASSAAGVSGRAGTVGLTGATGLTGTVGLTGATGHSGGLHIGGRSVP